MCACVCVYIYMITEITQEEQRVSAVWSLQKGVRQRHM